jgi:hypothetical protein
MRRTCHRLFIDVISATQLDANKIYCQWFDSRPSVPSVNDLVTLTSATLPSHLERLILALENV